MQTTFKRHKTYTGTYKTIEQAMIETLDHINKTNSMREYNLSKPHINEDNMMVFTCEWIDSKPEIEKVKFGDNNEHFDIIFKNSSGVSISTSDIKQIDTYLESYEGEEGKVKAIRYVYKTEDGSEYVISGSSFSVN